MTKEPMSRKSGKFRSLGFWLVTGAWGAGAFIYGWLLAGVLYKREYRSLSFEALGWTDWTLAILCGFIACVLSLLASSSRKSAGKESKQLLRIVVAVLPALFLVSALAVLTLTLATYNGDWIEARQGLATAFAALIAAVGVVVSVAVSYKTGEENRLAQQENLEKQLQSQQENLKTQLESQQKNLETQLEHQRTLEQEKGAREQQKLDAELIKNLNDRLHEIIPRRYGSRPAEVSASYFQLAALYRDWETLATTSDLIGGQKKSQQRNILKLLFGVYQEQTQTKGFGDGDNSAPQELSREVEQDFGNKSISRSQVDIRTLNSVIQDIFPDYQESKEELSDDRGEDLKDKDSEDIQYSYDLSYLDLRDLDLSQKDLNHAILKGAHLEGADLRGAYLEGADLRGAHLEGTHLVRAYLKDANLEGAVLKGANLWNTHLEGANLWNARLEGAELRGAHLEGAELLGARLERADLRGAQLKCLNLENVVLWNAHLEGANLWNTHLEVANMQGAHLERANLQDAHLRFANLYKAHLEGANLVEAELERANLRGVYLENASFFGPYENPQDTSARERVVNQLKEAAHLPSGDELLKAQGFDQALVDDIIKAHEEHHKDNQQ